MGNNQTSKCNGEPVTYESLLKHNINDGGDGIDNEYCNTNIEDFNAVSSLNLPESNATFFDEDKVKTELFKEQAKDSTHINDIVERFITDDEVYKFIGSITSLLNLCEKLDKPIEFFDQFIKTSNELLNSISEFICKEIKKVLYSL